MNRRAIIATAPLLLLAACTNQPNTNAPKKVQPTPHTPPSPPPSTTGGHGIEILTLDKPHGGAMGVIIQLTGWEVGTLDGTYGEDQQEGDPAVYVTAKLTNDTTDAISIPPFRDWEATNGTSSTPVPTLVAAEWTPTWPDRLLAGRSATERFALIGTPDDMTDVVITFTLAELGIQATWQGDVTQMI